MSLRTVFWAIVGAAAGLLLFGAASVPLFDPDESRFARTSVEMLRSGDPVVPRFGGEPRLVKPPLVHWIQSFLFGLVGPREWVARLHAAAATLGSLLLLGWIARRRYGPEGAVWTAAVFGSMPLVFVAGRVGTLDALLAVHVLAVVALDLGERESAGNYRAACTGALLGLGFLVKGPVGVILPLLILLAGRTATRARVLPGVPSVLHALVAWCLVVLPWGLAFVKRVGLSATLLTLRQELLEPYFAGTMHAEPASFFLLVAAAGFWPWLAPLGLGVLRAWRMRREPEAETALYAAAGLLAGLAFFSLGRAKLAAYILPLAPLAGLVVTWELGCEIAAPRKRHLGPTLLAATLASSSLLLGLFGPKHLEGAARTLAFVGAIVLALGAFVAIAGAIGRRPRLVYAAAASAAGATFLAAVLLLWPWLARTHSAAPLIAAVPRLATAEAIVTVEVRVPSLMFYLDRVPEVLDMQRLEERLSRMDRPLFVLVDVDLPSVPGPVLEQLDEIGHHGKYRVFEKKALRATTLDDPSGPG